MVMMLDIQLLDLTSCEALVAFSRDMVAGDDQSKLKVRLAPCNAQLGHTASFQQLLTDQRVMSSHRKLVFACLVAVADA